MSQPLLLQVPKQHDFRNPAVELNPKRLAAWLNELPLLNLSHSAKALLDSLTPCNLQPMPAKTRIRLLELYRQTFLAIFDALDEQSLRAQPISAQQRALARQCSAALCRELANGYKLLIRELHRKDPQREPLLPVALYRAVEILALTLLDSFRAYQVPPAFTYLELHHLHVLSESLGLLTQPVRLDKQTLSETGIGTLYQRILMLSAFDPYHLLAGMAAKLYDLLADLAPHARILEYQEHGPEGCYVVDRGSDGPPIACARAHSAYGFENPVLLDLRPAAQRAGERLQQRPADQRDQDETARLLAIVAPRLQHPRQRQAPRRETRRETWICFGIDAVHDYVAGGGALIAESIAQAQTLDDRREPGRGLEPWQIVNESVSGYLLASQGRWHGEARVGDAVAVITAGRDPQQPRLAVAVVRWMRAGRDQTVEMGIELIPGNIRAVHCESQGETVAALLFASVPALRLPDSIVAAKGTFAADLPFKLRIGNRATPVRAKALLKQTPYLEQFDFEGDNPV